MPGKRKRDPEERQYRHLRALEESLWNKYADREALEEKIKAAKVAVAKLEAIPFLHVTAEEVRDQAIELEIKPKRDALVEQHLMDVVADPNNCWPALNVMWPGPVPLGRHGLPKTYGELLQEEVNALVWSGFCGLQFYKKWQKLQTQYSEAKSKVYGLEEQLKSYDEVARLVALKPLKIGNAASPNVAATLASMLQAEGKGAGVLLGISIVIETEKDPDMMLRVSCRLDKQFQSWKTHQLYTIREGLGEKSPLVGILTDENRLYMRSHPEWGVKIGKALLAFAKDPRGYLMATGKRIGKCLHCNAPLTNPESRELGMGPICGGYYPQPRKAQQRA